MLLSLSLGHRRCRLARLLFHRQHLPCLLLSLSFGRSCRRLPCVLPSLSPGLSLTTAVLALLATTLHSGAGFQLLARRASCTSMLPPGTPPSSPRPYLLLPRSGATLSPSAIAKFSISKIKHINHHQLVLLNSTIRGATQKWRLAALPREPSCGFPSSFS